MEKLKHKVARPFWFRLTDQLGGPELDGREVPHLCADPECPGDINRRKLELFDRLQALATHRTGIDWQAEQTFDLIAAKLQAAEEMSLADLFLVFSIITVTFLLYWLADPIAFRLYEVLHDKIF